MSVLGQKRTPVKLPARLGGMDSAAPSDGFRRSNRYQLQRVQMIAEDLDLKPYAEWSPVRVADPRAATPEQFLDGFRKICADEGPIIEDRLYALYARAAELGRVYGPVRQKFERALQTALEAKHLIASRETFGAHDERVITLPDQPPVSVRERGPRSLHEIPGTEIAEVMLAIRVEHDLIGRDELFRAVLAAYKLKRLTQASESRLNDVLTTWLA